VLSNFRRTILIITVALASVSVLVGSAWAANLIKGGTFDSGIPNAGFSNGIFGPYNFWYYASDSSTSVYTNYESAYQGFGWGPVQIYGAPNAIRLSPAAASYANLMLSQEVLVAPGEWYEAGVVVNTYANDSTTGFGTHSGDIATLRVLELDSWGGPVGDIHETSVTASNLVFHPLSLNFQTTIDTAKCVYQLIAITNNCNFAQGHVTWDNAVLSGPPPPYEINGYVRDNYGTSLLATVEAGGESTNTDQDGHYSMTVRGDVTVRASCGGFFAQQKVRSAPQPGEALTVDFALTLVGDNILANAGFDDGWLTGGWQPRKDLHLVMGPEEWGVWIDGECASTMWASMPNQSGTIYQYVGVLPDTEYSASCYLFVTGTLWGSEPDQKAGLWIGEVNVLGQVTADQLITPTSYTPGNWMPLNNVFVTASDTVALKFGGYAAFVEVQERAVFEMFELLGPAGATPPELPSLQGYVKKNGGTAVSGAKVEIIGAPLYKTSSDSSGFWELNPPTRDAAYVVRASAPGCYASRRTVSAPNVIDFDLQEVGSNLVANAGFEDGISAGGWIEYSSTCYAEPESKAVERNWPPPYFYAGDEAYTFWGGAALHHVQLCQFIPVLPNTDYTAKLRFLGALLPGVPGIWGSDEDNQAAMIVEEYDATGTLVGTPQTVSPVSYSGWQTLTASFSSAPTTASVRIVGDAKTVMSVYGTGNRAVFDAFELNGSAGPANRIGSIKRQPDGATVALYGKVVTHATADYLYVEDDDQTAGIRVDGAQPYSPAAKGDVVTVWGTLATVDGERVVVASAVNPMFQSPGPFRGVEQPRGEVPAPMAMNNRTITENLASGVYVKAWGKVTLTGSTFNLSDGSGDPIKVYSSDLSYSAADGDLVAVLGVVGAELVSGNATPVLRVSEVTKLN